MRICGGETGAIAFATDAEKLSQGFEEQVTNYLRKHPQVKLVIVDTLIKVREMNSRGSAYADDYATMTAFKRIAERYGITMLIVHHTRKQEAGDIMDMISGTTGIMGCADGAAGTVGRHGGRTMRTTADAEPQTEFEGKCII